jgi:hypothetical protein
VAKSENGSTKPKKLLDRRDELIGHVAGGMRPGAAAEALGFKRSELYELLDDDEEFAELVDLAQREATEHVEEALYQAAVSGNVTAAKIWLERTEGKQTSTAVVVAAPGGESAVERINRIARGEG